MKLGPTVAVLLGLGACASEPALPPKPGPAPAVSVPPASSAPVGEAPPSGSALPSFDDPIHAELPQIRRLTDVKRHAGELAEIHGRYDVEPVAGSKALQAVTILLADGDRLIRAYRPVKEELDLDGQRVVVVGRAYLDANQPAHVQQVMAPHVEVKSLSLHPMVSPYETGRTRVRTPPAVAKLADLGPLRDRWVQVFATLRGVTPNPGGGSFGTAALALSGGAIIDLKDVVLSRWSPLVGQPISTIVRVTAPPADVALVGARKVCPGKVERCGMD